MSQQSVILFRSLLYAGSLLATGLPFPLETVSALSLCLVEMLGLSKFLPPFSFLFESFYPLTILSAPFLNEAWLRLMTFEILGIFTTLLAT